MKLASVFSNGENQRMLYLDANCLNYLSLSVSASSISCVSWGLENRIWLIIVSANNRSANLSSPSKSSQIIGAQLGHRSLVQGGKQKEVINCSSLYIWIHLLMVSTSENCTCYACLLPSTNQWWMQYFKVTKSRNLALQGKEKEILELGRDPKALSSTGPRRDPKPPSSMVSNNFKTLHEKRVPKVAYLLSSLTLFA